MNDTTPPPDLRERLPRAAGGTTGLRSLLTREQIAELTRRSDWRGACAIASTWAVIGATLWLLALWPHPLMWGVALVVIAGRQLALAILQHEAAHGTLFRTRWMNDVFGDWLCARPIWQDVRKYRAHHRRHHSATGSDADPDRSLIAPFPVSRAALSRKLLRDLTGMTGLKVLYGRLLMDAGVIRWTVANDVQRLPANGRRIHDYVVTALRNMLPMMIVNAGLFAILAVSGHAWLYGVWVLAYVTPFPVFVRIRSMAEHACTERSADPLRNTRSTRAGWLARATVAPFNVNYHIEHHLMASVPYYRLPALRRLLRARGAVAPAPSYVDVLRIVSTPPAPG